MNGVEVTFHTNCPSAIHSTFGRSAHYTYWVCRAHGVPMYGAFNAKTGVLKTTKNELDLEVEGHRSLIKRHLTLKGQDVNSTSFFSL